VPERIFSLVLALALLASQGLAAPAGQALATTVTANPGELALKSLVILHSQPGGVRHKDLDEAAFTVDLAKKTKALLQGQGLRVVLSGGRGDFEETVAAANAMGA
jgi:hypothetical protein